MSVLPDELWRRILEIGVETRRLSFKDLCCISISCSSLARLSDEDALWSLLFSHDFPPNNSLPPSSSSASIKSLYRIRFESDSAKQRAAHGRALLRMNSHVAQHSRQLYELQVQMMKETQNRMSAVSELSNLRKVRQASVALNVWQPEHIRVRQEQIVEQCVVPVESRITALEMELKICEKQIEGLDKAYKKERQRLEKAEEQLLCLKYHPVRDYNLTSNMVEKCMTKTKNLKRSTNWNFE